MTTPRRFYEGFTTRPDIGGSVGPAVCLALALAACAPVTCPDLEPHELPSAEVCERRAEALCRYLGEFGELEAAGYDSVAACRETAELECPYLGCGYTVEVYDEVDDCTWLIEAGAAYAQLPAACMVAP